MLFSISFSFSKPSLSPPSILNVLRRSFVNARVKWVRDPYLDFAVEREKNLKPSLCLKHLIISSPSSSLPLSSLALSNPQIDLPPTTSAVKFLRRYPSLFKVFRPPHSPLPHVKLTRQFLGRHREEMAIHETEAERKMAAQRLVKLLMLARASRVPLGIIDGLKLDLGLPDNYILDLVSHYPDYFRVCRVTSGSNPEEIQFGLELVSWREDLAVSAAEKRVLGDDTGRRKRETFIDFPMSFSPGFDLQKKVKEWTVEWLSLPYISPYENAFHLAPSSDQAEKWAVSVIHELLSILVSKKTELKNIFGLGEYWGFGPRLKKAIVHFPGIFYVSNKIRTQTVVLREAYRKDCLLAKHPLMGMRYRYIHLMSKSRKLRKDMKKMRCGSSYSTQDAVLVHQEF